MHLHIKYQGFKNLRTTEFIVNSEPADTIVELSNKLEKITGISADSVSIISGLILGNPSGSFKKLDKSGTVSDNGLRHGSTLIVFVPVGQENSSAAAPAPAPTPSPQITRRAVCVGKAIYRSSASESIKSGDIVAVAGDSKTTLMFEGVEYANAQEWLTKAFNNSGKSCCVQFEKSQTVDTPRPRRYVPPSNTCPFDRYM